MTLDKDQNICVMIEKYGKLVYCCSPSSYRKCSEAYFVERKILCDDFGLLIEVFVL